MCSFDLDSLRGRERKPRARHGPTRPRTYQDVAQLKDDIRRGLVVDDIAVELGTSSAVYQQRRKMKKKYYLTAKVTVKLFSFRGVLPR